MEISNCPIGKVDTHAFNSLSDTLQELWLFNDSLSEFPFINSLRHLQSIALNRNNVIFQKVQFPQGNLNLKSIDNQDL